MNEADLEIIDEISSGMAILDGLNEAIIGYDSNTTRIIYDYDLILEILIEKHSLTIENAIEYIDYNIVSLQLNDDEGNNISPIIFNRFPFDESND
jgi:hypothetical protein